MKQFWLGNNEITFDDTFEKFNGFRIGFTSGLDALRNELADMLKKEIDNSYDDSVIEKIVNEMPSIAQQSIRDAIPHVIDFLTDMEVYDCDEALFIRRYENAYFNFANSSAYRKLKASYDDIEEAYQELKQYRAMERASRSQWVGGGFGIKGAIKGSLEAGAMNMVTGAFRGIGDAFTDASDSSKYSSEKQKLAKADGFYNDIANAFTQTVTGVIYGCEEEYAKHTGYQFTWDLEKYRSQSLAIFNNVSRRVNDIEKIEKLMAQAIQLNPYNEKYYSFLLKQDGIDKKQVFELAIFLGYSLEDDRVVEMLEEWVAIDDEYFLKENKMLTASGANPEYVQQAIAQMGDKEIDYALLYKTYREEGKEDFQKEKEYYDDIINRILNKAKDLYFLDRESRPINVSGGENDTNKAFGLDVLVTCSKYALDKLEVSVREQDQLGKSEDQIKGFIRKGINGIDQRFHMDEYKLSDDDDIHNSLNELKFFQKSKSFNGSHSFEETQNSAPESAYNIVSAETQKISTTEESHLKTLSGGDHTRELEYIVKQVNITDQEKLQKIDEFSEKYSLFVNGTIRALDADIVTVNTVRFYKAFFEVKIQYGDAIEEQIKNPTDAIHALTKNVLNICHKYSVINSTNYKRWEEGGIDWNADAVDGIPFDHSKDVEVLDRYISELCQIDDYTNQFAEKDYSPLRASRKERVESIVETCKKYMPIKGIQIGDGDEKWMHDSEIAKHAEVPNNEIICLTYSYGTILGDCGYVLTERGIYGYTGASLKFEWSKLKHAFIDDSDKYRSHMILIDNQDEKGKLNIDGNMDTLSMIQALIKGSSHLVLFGGYPDINLFNAKSFIWERLNNNLISNDYRYAHLRIKDSVINPAKIMNESSELGCYEYQCVHVNLYVQLDAVLIHNDDDFSELTYLFVTDTNLYLNWVNHFSYGI